MSVWVVVGGQYGSEGKGKIAAYLTQKEGIDICIRCGGPNSGHSFIGRDGAMKLVRQIPTGFVVPKSRLLIAAGALIDPLVLRTELEELDLGPDRVGIDSNCMVIEQSDKDTEQALDLHGRLSSTLCGVGAAVARRVLRGADVKLARDLKEHKWLTPYLTSVSLEANAGIDAGKKVLVEGTQGFGLSLYHSEHYPKTTSRDTTAGGFLSEVGLSPVLVNEIVVVFRTFPIRVAGNQAGPLTDEVTWDEIRNQSRSPRDIREYTTVTKKERRVGRFDWHLALRALQANRPTRIAMNFMDYLSYQDSRKQSLCSLGESAQKFIKEFEERTESSIRYLGTGPGLEDVIDSNLDGSIQLRGATA